MIREKKEVSTKDVLQLHFLSVIAMTFTKLLINTVRISPTINITATITMLVTKALTVAVTVSITPPVTANHQGEISE